MKLSTRTYPLGPIQTNCYIVSNINKQCLIFDPGEEGERLIREIKANQLKPLAIFLTHTHFDHIGAVNELRDAFDIPVYVHEKEVDWLADPMKNGSGKYAELPNYVVDKPKEEHIIRKEQVFNIENFVFKAVFTPGHSPGSISYIFEEEGFAIVGDTLFEGSIGRTDLIGGSMPVLLQSIHDKLLSLAEDTIIYPGHGDYTTPATEMETNPFLNGF
ncbi:MBL fold metallo-hydrolase [Bacillus ndiopicus]|uniref:MBL fold metallo-hydrolase n=1 Tax=Bacillus ndiopicus TaxID=1347368 RepID=UPI0005A96119|nr:MBL fold metallo-hydrolase [Bacillus ndiopicus]